MIYCLSHFLGDFTRAPSDGLFRYINCCGVQFSIYRLSPTISLHLWGETRKDCVWIAYRRRIRTQRLYGLRYKIIIILIHIIGFTTCWDEDNWSQHRPRSILLMLHSHNRAPIQHACCLEVLWLACAILAMQIKRHLKRVIARCKAHMYLGHKCS